MEQSAKDHPLPSRGEGENPGMDAEAAAREAGLTLMRDERGLTLSDGRMEVRGDFTHMIPRLKPANLGRELLVRAAKVKGRSPDLHATNEEGSKRPIPVGERVLARGPASAEGPASEKQYVLSKENTLYREFVPVGEHALAGPTAVDATAGLGEDALLLAAAGFEVQLFERNPVIAALLADAVDRAALVPELAQAISRMHVRTVDSIEALPALLAPPDVILLDPMFPEKRKSASAKKKAQLLQRLERPCENEATLLAAAIAASPRKIVIKRPVKGPHLAGHVPSYSLSGKAIRYDCIVVPRQ